MATNCGGDLFHLFGKIFPIFSIQNQTNNWSSVIENLKVEDLPIFSAELKPFTEKIQRLLDKLYAKNIQISLQNELNHQVEKLLVIENEIQTFLNNVRILNQQIVAVKAIVIQKRRISRRTYREELRKRIVLQREQQLSLTLPQRNLPENRIIQFISRPSTIQEEITSEMSFSGTHRQECTHGESEVTLQLHEIQ